MSDEKFYRIPQPFHPFPNTLPAPSASPDDPESQVCIMVSRYWLPYILGALKVFQYDDIWEVPSEQLKNDGQMLLRRFMSVFSCGDDMREIELRSTPSGDCQQFQWRYVGDAAWIDLGDPVCDGDDGQSPEFQLVPAGELCQTIQYRLVGDSTWISLGQVCNGADGDDCDCGDPTPTQPPIEPLPEDRCEIACNIAMGLGKWFCERYGDTLGFASAAFQAGAIIADAVSDFIDAFPIFGAVVNSVVDYMTGLGALDISALQAANNNEFREWVQCELYRIMADDTDDFTLGYFDQVKDELQIWGIALPPQGPLLTIIGQMFAAFLETVPASEILRRANVYKDNVANCDLCDVDCGVSESTCYRWPFTDTTLNDGGWTRWDVSGIGGSQLIGTHNSGVGWEDSYNSARGIRGIGIEKTFEDITINKIEVDYHTVFGGDTDPGGSPIPLRIRGFEPSGAVLWSEQDSGFGFTATFTYEPVGAELADINKLELLSSVSTSNAGSPTDHGGTATIFEVRVYTADPIPEGTFDGGEFCPE